MPKKNRSKKMRGGWGWPWDKKEETTYGSTEVSGSSSGPGMWDSFTKGVSSISNSASSMVSSSPSTPSDTLNTHSQPSVSGGRRRRKSNRMRGGYSDNLSLTNLASRASPFSGSTARAQAYVGGRCTKRRCHKNKKSNRRHYRK